MSTTEEQVKNRTQPVAKTANDKQIYADLMRMPLAFSIGRNPHLLTLVGEVLEPLQPTAKTVVLEHDMGRMIGYSEVVPTVDTDIVFYARQNKDTVFTRFVKNRPATATQFITITLSRDDDGNYELQDVWLGKAYPALPSEDNVTKASNDFWSSHAVVYNGQGLMANSLTKDWPY